MASLSYFAASVYVSWIGVNQKKVAELRVKESLESCLGRNSAESWLQNWEQRAPALYNKLQSMAYQPNPCLDMKKSVLYMYLGPRIANDYIEHFGLYHDARETLARLSMMLNFPHVIYLH